MSKKSEFFKAMKKRGFDIKNTSFATIPVIARHRKTPEGHSNIISNITVISFQGCNTKDGDLGCITFACKGIQRLKSHKIEKYYQEQEIIKEALCPKTVEAAITAYANFAEKAQKTMDSWELIL